MKNIVILTLALMVSVIGVNAQTFTPPTLAEDSVFINNPELIIHGLRGNFGDTRLMFETLELNERVWEYQAKQVRGMVIGGVGMAIAGAGWWYTLGYLDPPVYQPGNPATANADELKRKQQIWGWASTALFAASATYFAISFKNHKRLRAEVGLNNLKLRYRLFGKRDYFNEVGKHPKHMKNRGLYPTRYR